MDIVTIALAIVVVVLVYFLLRQRETPVEEGKDTAMVLLQQRIEKLAEVMHTKLGEGNKQTVAQFDRSLQLVKNIEERVSSQLLEVAKGMAENKESTKQVFTIAEQLHSLESVLKNQKQRGNLGEASLELILSNVLPGQYESQYEFHNGEKVDFVVKTKDGILPVDAKFPLENYLRLTNELDPLRQEQFRKDFKADVKAKIDQTAKYIREEEGTLPFAIMFIPAEGIYYDLLNNDVGIGINAQDLIEYAYSKKNVLIASPTTFLAYLQTVLLGNRRAKFEEAAKDIIQNVSKLARDLKTYEESHNSMGRSLSAAVGHFEKSGKAFRSIDKDVVKIANEPIALELESVDRPLLPEPQ